MARGATGEVILTPVECRTARAALGWSQSTLAEKAGTDMWSVNRFEKTGYGAKYTHTQRSAVRRMREAFLDAGVLLEMHNGLSVVKFRRDEVA